VGEYPAPVDRFSEAEAWQRWRSEITLSGQTSMPGRQWALMRAMGTVRNWCVVCTIYALPHSYTTYPNEMMPSTRIRICQN